MKEENMKRYFILLAITILAFAQGDLNLLEKAKTARENGKLKAAQESLGKIITDYPESENLAEAYYILGEIAYKSSKYELAMKHYRSAIQLEDSEFSPAAYFRLAKCYEKLEQPMLALFTYVKQVNTYPNSKRAPATRGFIRKLEGKIDY